MFLCRLILRLVDRCWHGYQQGGVGGHSNMPCGHTCDRGQDLDRQFFTVWLLTAQNFGVLTVGCNLWPPRYISHSANAVSGTCGSRRELVLLHLQLHCGNKSVTIGLQLVLCTYDLFSATGLIPRPPVLFVSQPTGTATMQRWLCWCITHEKLGRNLGTRLIFTVKSDSFRVLYFDRWPAAKTPFWLLTTLWPWSQLWLQGIWDHPPCIKIC